MRIALITVPYTSSGLTTGEARVPDVLRAAGLLDAARSSGRDVADYGDVAFEPHTPARDPLSGIIAPRALTQMVLAVRASVTRAAAEALFPIVIGGECPLLLGCLATAGVDDGRGRDRSARSAHQGGRGQGRSRESGVGRTRRVVTGDGRLAAGNRP